MNVEIFASDIKTVIFCFKTNKQEKQLEIKKKKRTKAHESSDFARLSEICCGFVHSHISESVSTQENKSLF